MDIDRISVGSNGLVAFFDQIAVSKDVVRSKSWPKRGAGKKSMVGYGWISQELDHIKHYGKMYGHNTIYSYLLDINLAHFHVKCVRDLSMTWIYAFYLISVTLPHKLVVSSCYFGLILCLLYQL